MDRRRIAVVAAGLVLFGGVIVVLRTAGDGGTATPTSTSVPPPTSLAPFAAEGVLLPTKGEKPKPPEDLEVEPGPQRLRLKWTGEAPGYEVRWGKDDALDRSKLIAQRTTQLDGLQPGSDYRVEVRAIDSFGQRSEVVSRSGKPGGDTSGDQEFALLDRFDQDNAPDPNRWRLLTRATCARATPGRGDDAGRLVISSNCAAAPVSLRSRTPFALADADELGRFVVETDGPGVDGELFLDLVPGPVGMVNGIPTGQASDRAVDAVGLPAGAIRARIASGGGITGAQVLVAPGTPRIAPIADRVQPVAASQTGITQRWELVLRRDGVRILRDGVLIATGDVVPQWREASAVIGVAGPTVDRVNVDLVAFGGAQAKTPPLVQSPPVTVTVGAIPVPDTKPEPIAWVTGGQLRMTITHSDASGVAPELSAQVGTGTTVPLRPALPGVEWRPDIGYPVVADLPPEALVLVGEAKSVVVALQTTLRLQATHIDLELTPRPGAAAPAPTSTETAPVNGTDVELARVDGVVLDASGKPVESSKPLQRGRLVLDVTLDGGASQRTGGRLAGLAGFTVRMDGDRVASVSTAADGPGVVGDWRLALNTGALSPGPHMIEIRAFGTEPTTRPAASFVSFFVSE